MYKPWENKTGIAKAVAILATMPGISIGLCGANAAIFAVVGRFDPTNHPNKILAGLQEFLGVFLTITAFAEGAVIVLSLAGLLLLPLGYVLIRWTNADYFRK